jgi:putative aldouronate transport system substrate-binding protein
MKGENMKKILSLIFAALFVLALFAGCGGNANTPNNNVGKATPAPATAAPGAEATPEPTPDSPYNYAVGKYELDDEGWPVAKYEYELPLATTGEKFSQWTICWTPQYLPEDGYDGLGMYAGLQEMTGVDIEYFLVASASRAENFAVLLNSDDLCDIMSQGAYYWTSGTLQDGVDDGYLVNFYNYREYLPNYLWEINSRSKINANLKPTVFYKPEVWISMAGLFETPIQNTGYMLRQDFLDELNLGNAHDVKTYDQLHDILTAFKAAKDETFWPMMIYSTFELAAFNWCGFSTTPSTTSLSYLRVVDGEVQFCGTTNDDKDLMTMLNQWWNEGLIDPNWSSYAAGAAAIGTAQANDKLGCAIMTPSTVAGDEALCINPKCQWEPTQRLRKTEDQILKWGFSTGDNNYGSAIFSAKCSNIPLLMTFMDYQYSDSGALWCNWGPEGELWYYDADGKRMLTEFALTHEAGTAWLQDCFCYNELGDAGIQLWTRNYAYEGGERFVAMFDTWSVKGFYQGDYVWPAAIKFEDEEQQIINANRTDANTYFTENYSRFFTGDLPFSEWDSYVQAMMDMGLATVLEIYQEGYDAYIESLS